MQEIEIVSKCMNANDFTMAYTEGEHTVLQLMNEVKNINSKVAGTSGSHIAMCNEIRALMNAHSIPPLFLTINLADMYNPLVQLLQESQLMLMQCSPKKSQTTGTSPFLLPIILSLPLNSSI